MEFPLPLREESTEELSEEDFSDIIEYHAQFLEEYEKNERELINHYLEHFLDEVDPEEQAYREMEEQREMDC